MDLGFILFLAALIAGLTSGYTTRILARGPFGVAQLQAQGMFRVVTGGLAFPALLGAIIWGFIKLKWWWVITIFLGVSLLVVPIIFGRRQERSHVMIAIQPIFDLICIGSVAFLWISEL